MDEDPKNEPERPPWPEGGPVRMTDERMRAFIHDWCSGHIFTSDDCSPNILHMCFMPIALGAMKDCPKEWIEKCAFLYEHMSARMLNRGINGCPIFFSMQFLHVDDWAIIKPNIEAELARRKEIPLVRP